MRIWLQKHIIAGRMSALDEWYADHISAVVEPTTEVRVHTLPERAYASETPFDYVPYGVVALRFNQYFAETAVAAEQDGYDAWVIAAGQDPGLPAARTLATIPTFGFGRTAFEYCAAHDLRFGVIGFMPGLREPIVENIHRYRCEHLLAGYELLPGARDATVAAVHGDPTRFLEEFEQSATAARRAGAQVVIPAEGVPAEIVWHYGVRELAGLPVLDPLGLLLTTAETQVRLTALGSVARPTSGYWYARPDPEVLAHIDDVFARNSIDSSATPSRIGATT